MKNRKDLARRLCKMEGKKKQVDIAQMAETLKNLGILMEEDPIRVLAALGYFVGVSIESIDKILEV
jgi:hypothetical protein